MVQCWSICCRALPGWRWDPHCSLHPQQAALLAEWGACPSSSQPFGNAPSSSHSSQLPARLPPVQPPGGAGKRGLAGSPSAADVEPEPATMAEPDTLEPWLPRLPVSWLPFSPPGRLKGSPELGNSIPRTVSRKEPRLSGTMAPRTPQAARPEFGPRSLYREFHRFGFQCNAETKTTAFKCSSPLRAVIIFLHTTQISIL